MRAAAVNAEWPEHLDTDAFHVWFDKSQVVDGTGLPRVCYHGTLVWQRGDGSSLGVIDAFDRMASVNRVRRRPSIDTVGSWFSTEPGPQGAGMYAGDGGAIYPVYLSIQNPYRTTFATMVRRGHMLAGTPHETIQAAPGVYETAAYRFGQLQVDALREWLKTTGRDGIHLRHDPTKGEGDEFFLQECWIALEPGQIKSALANRGTYDPHDPRIAFKRAAQPEVVAEDNDEDERCAPRF